MLHDVLGGEPRPRGHGRELREGRRGRVLGMQDDRAFEAPGLRHRIHDNLVARPDDLGVDGEMRPPDFAEGDGPSFTYEVRCEDDRTLYRVYRTLADDRLPQVH